MNDGKKSFFDRFADIWSTASLFLYPCAALYYAHEAYSFQAKTGFNAGVLFVFYILIAGVWTFNFWTNLKTVRNIVRLEVQQSIQIEADARVLAVREAADERVARMREIYQRDVEADMRLQNILTKTISLVGPTKNHD